MATNKTCLDRQREGFSGAGRSSYETTLPSARYGPSMARSAVHTSRVTLFVAGYGVGTVGRVRFGPVSGFSSGFPGRQALSFL